MKCSKCYISKACKPKWQISVYSQESQEIATLGKQQRAKKNRLPLHFLRNAQQNNCTHKVFLQLVLSEFLIPKRCISNSFMLAKQESLCCTNSRERPPVTTASLPGLCLTTTLHSDASLWSKLQGYRTVQI